MEYFIYITNDCNLMCEYCSVLVDCTKSNIPLQPNYDVHDLITFIQRTQEQQNDQDVVVYFFGGEPTLEYDRIKTLTDAIRQYLSNYNVSLVLHTNGLLLNQIPQKLVNDLTLIMLSINYEKVPNFGLSQSYFSSIVENVVLTKRKKEMPIIARLTITEKTSLYSEVMLFSHYFDMVYWQIENTPEFNNFNAFYETYTYETELLYTYWKNLLSTGRMLKFVPFMSVLKFMFFHDRNDNEFACGSVMMSVIYTSRSVAKL